MGEVGYICILRTNGLINEYRAEILAQKVVDGGDIRGRMLRKAKRES